MKFLFKHNVSYFIRLVLELKIVKIVKHYVINFEKKFFFTENQALCVKKTWKLIGNIIYIDLHRFLDFQGKAFELMKNSFDVWKNFPSDTLQEMSMLSLKFRSEKENGT